MIKILINGKGGHGVKLGTHILGQIVASHNKHVAVYYEYDAAIRGQDITAFITISDKKIANPIFDAPDIELNLEDFEKTALTNFNSIIYTTMLAIGKILKELSLTIHEEEFKGYIQKEPETNWRAINYFLK